MRRGLDRRYRLPIPARHPQASIGKAAIWEQYLRREWQPTDVGIMNVAKNTDIRVKPGIVLYRLTVSGNEAASRREGRIGQQGIGSARGRNEIQRIEIHSPGGRPHSQAGGDHGRKQCGLLSSKWHVYRFPFFAGRTSQLVRPVWRYAMSLRTSSSRRRPRRRLRPGR